MMVRKTLMVFLLLSLSLTGCSKSDSLDEGAGAQQEEVKKENRGILGKRTQEVGDYEQLMKDNPNLVRVPDRVNTESVAKTISSTMLVKGSEASRFGMFQVIRTFQAEHDRFPSYDEFMGIMKESGSSFTQLPASQFYAYSAEAGEIMILEEPSE